MVDVVIFIWHWKKNCFRSIDRFTPELDAEVGKVAGEVVYDCVTDDARPFTDAGFAPKT